MDGFSLSYLIFSPMSQRLPWQTVLVSPSLEILRSDFPKEKPTVSRQGVWQGGTTGCQAAQCFWRAGNPIFTHPTTQLVTLALVLQPCLLYEVLPLEAPSLSKGVQGKSDPLFVSIIFCGSPDRISSILNQSSSFHLSWSLWEVLICYCLLSRSFGLCGLKPFKLFFPCRFSWVRN